jgi:zinc and cadmium transporter
MTTIWLYTLLSIGAVSLISLIGALTISIQTEKLKRTLFVLISFAAGALLGDVFFHLLPELIDPEAGLHPGMALWILFGIVLLFIIEKFIHWHHCHGPEDRDEHVHPFALTNLVGDGLHNFIDGMIIAASFLVAIPVGIATTIAVVLHEIPQEISDFGILLHGGFSKKQALALNFVSSLTAFAGALIVLGLGALNPLSVAIPLSIACGSFIYIAGADLIPEIHKEVNPKKSLLQLIALLAGIGVMFALLLLE